MVYPYLKLHDLDSSQILPNFELILAISGMDIYGINFGTLH